MSDLPENDELDPVLVSSIRELKWIVAIWTVSVSWVIGFCGVFGFGEEASRHTVMGMPWWAFWGVFVPWFVTALITCLFAMFIMEDHPLDDGESAESTDA